MKQHIVSKCYLKAWCDPAAPANHEPYIWLISYDGTQKTKKPPAKSLGKSHAYTIMSKDGTYDLSIEITLGQLESRFVRVQRKICERTNLDAYDRAYLAAFMATMHCRADPFSASMEKLFGRIDEMVSDLENAMKSRKPLPPLPRLVTARGEGAVVNSYQLETVRENARPLGVGAALKFAAPIIAQMSVTFLVAPRARFS